MSRRTPQRADSPTGLDGYPAVMRLDDVVGLIRRGKSTVLREIGLGTLPVMPFASHPYRWYRADWEEYFATRPRPKGSVAWKLKPARAPHPMARRRSARPSSQASSGS